MNTPVNDVSFEVRAARAGVALWQADDLGALVVDGADATPFLHNLLTANIKSLAVNTGAFALRCTPKGMPLFALHVYRTETTRYLLLTARDRTQALADDLEKYHITEAVTIQQTSDALGVIALQGPNARRLLATVSTSDVSERLEKLRAHESCAASISGAGVRVIRESLTGDEGFLVVAASQAAPALLASLSTAGEKFGIVTPSPQAREIMRIEAGLPAWGSEVTDRAIAAELGIEHEAFNYDKGCYVGQEILARIRTKGEVPFLIMGATLPPESPTPSRGDRLTDAQGVEAAIVTSTCVSPMLGRVIVLARIKRGFQHLGLKLRYTVGDKTFEAELVALPFYAPTASSVAHGEQYERALILFAHNREDEAVALLQGELSRDPSNLDAWEALGVIHDRAGRRTQAIDAMMHIVDAQPKHLMANVNLSLYYMKQGDKQTAEEYQAKATRISLERRMAEAKAQGKTGTVEDEAARLAKLEARAEKFKAIIDMDPNDVLGRFGAGKAYMDLKRFREAAEHFSRVVEIQPDYSVAWANLGTCHVALGDKESARRIFTQGIEIARKKGDMMPLRDMEHRLSLV